MKKSLLFTIVMALLCLFGNVKAQTETTANSNGVLEFTYPSTTNVLVWTGAGADNNWTTAANWMDGTKTPLRNWNNHNVPTCDIYIPENANGKYPVLNSTAACNRIYLESGAMLGNQFYLTATNGWYTDIVIPTNCWVLLSSPLKNTYTGDFFTATQGGKYSDAWSGSEYAGTDGQNGNNRSFPSSIYQRLFSSYVTIDYLSPYTCYYYETAWSTPTNALARQYQIAEGYQVLARDLNNTPSADFHFPSATDTYYFYNTRGVAQQNYSATVSHTESNRPAYSSNEIRPIITRETPGSSDVPPMFAVGNPSFAKLNIAEFLKENAIGGNITPYLYKHNEGNISNIIGSETIYYYDLTGNNLFQINATADDFHMPTTTNRTDATGAVIERNRGFRVMAGKAEVKCIEPDLLGIYSCEATAATVEYYANSRNRNNSDLYGNANASVMTISTGATPNEVFISNFAGWANVKGTINTEDKTITINGGQEASMITDRAMWGSSGWNCSGSQALYLMGCSDENLSYSSDMLTLSEGAWVATRRTKYAINVSASTPVVLSYNIDRNGSVTFQIENKFALYPANNNHYYLLGNLSSDLQYMTSWICFEDLHGTKSKTYGSSQFINTNIFGTYQYTINGRSSWTVAADNSNHSFTITPIAGKYDIVEITGFYPNTPDTKINGKIESTGNSYKLIIPGGQRVYESGDITNDYFMYDEDLHDIEMTLNADGSLSLSKSIMVTRLNSKIKSWNLFDWSTVSGYKTTTTITKTGSWDGQITDPTQILVGTNKNSISLYFNQNMFTVEPNTTNSQAPRLTAAQGSTAASINASYDNHTINTMILRGQKAMNCYNPAEDAALVDNDDEAFSISTVAGSYRCVVNAINDTTRCQIVLTGVNGDVDLVFDNLAALGENVRLFDANDSTYTPLNGNHATTTVTFGVNDSPLRYSLVWDYTPIIAGNETLTAIDFTAFSPAKGEVKVMSNELLKGVRIYNAAGQLITSNNANANEVSFSNLLSGIYVIEAYTANGKATKKVDVK